jgi:hypothetical protein
VVPSRGCSGRSDPNARLMPRLAMKSPGVPAGSWSRSATAERCVPRSAHEQSTTNDRMRCRSRDEAIALPSWASASAS